MRVRTVLGYAVSGFILLTMSGCMSAQPSSTSSIPTLEIISIGPPSPAVLEAGQKVTVKVRYDMGDCESVQIWVRSSSSSRGEISHPCSPMPRTNGQRGTMEGWFYFDDTAQVKEIKVVMKDIAKNAYVYEVTKTVDYRWQGKGLLETVKDEGVTQIPGTYSWDIERDQIKGSSQAKDVWWEQLNSTERNLVARNQAKLSLITGVGYDQVDVEYLKKLPYNLGKISGSDNDSQLKPGTLVGIRTTEGNYAKIEILPSQSARTLIVRWKLYLDTTTRNAQTVNYQRSSLPAPLAPNKFEGTTRIPASYTWDADTYTIGGNSKNVDLWWKWDRSSQQSIVARNGAGMAILTNLSFDQIDLERLQNYSYDQQELSLSGTDSLVKPGLQLGLKTSEGRYAKLELLSDGFPKYLVFRWKLYPESKIRESKSPNPTRTDPVKQYGGLWYYADPWGRSDDRIAVLEGRIDGRNVLSFELVKHFCSSKPVCTETVTQKDQIEIRFDDVRYPDSDKPGTTMRYSLLYQEGTLLGQVFRDGVDPEKVLLRRLDSTMMNQIISGLGKENRDLRSRLEREQTQAASEKNALKSNLESLEKTNGQLRSENSELSDQHEKILKTVQALEDMLRQAKVTKQD
jgi:hypothetical protein